MKKTILFVLVLAGLHTTAQVQKIQNLQITGGTPGLNKVLVSDANGNASWQSLETIGLTPIGSFTSSTGKVWMDRNLGATRVATAATDYLAYGDLYQWGRGADGHQKINWTSSTTGTAVNGTTTTLSSTDTPGNALFVTINSGNYDWRNPQNNSLWQGVSGTNNPCPSGYRVPTQAELDAEIAAYSITNSASAYASPFKFTVAGYRYNADGLLYNVSSVGYYWTSTVSSFFNIYRYFDTSTTTNTITSRAGGFSVRCVKD